MVAATSIPLEEDDDDDTDVETREIIKILAFEVKCVRRIKIVAKEIEIDLPNLHSVKPKTLSTVERVF